MKRAVWLLGLIALVAGAVPARAQLSTEQHEEKYLQVPHRFQIFLDGGLGLPAQPGLFKDYWNTAFQLGVGFGMVIFPWLEVNGTYNHSSFNNNDIQSKEKLKYEGVTEVKGGAVHTRMIWGSARFIAAPHARTNPYIEVGIGGFKTTADDLTIEGVLRNSMDPVSGMCFVPCAGIQYAMNERWTTYAKYTYAINFNQAFAPGDLLLPVDATTKTIGGNQVISSLAVGIMCKF